MLSTAAACAQLRISEFMASNTRTLADETGSFEDWIEIQNVSSATVNLFDWALTDSAGNLTKWKFPSTNVPPGGFLVVFASNKDRRTAGAPLHTNFKLDAGGEYLALVDPTGTNIATQFAPKYPPQVPDVSYGFSVIASNVTLVATGATARVLVPSEANGGSTLDYTWTGLAANEPFNTSAWISGATGVGFGAPGVGLDIQASMLNSNASAFVRVPFTLDNPTNFSVLTLNLRYNDGFVAWINGVQIARAFAPTEDLAWNSGATAVHTNMAFESMALGIATNLLRSGTNILAIQGLNASVSDGTFVILPELLGTMLAGEVTSGLYLTAPTPGAENIGGSSVPGPGIANVSHTPNVPADDENLVVTAKVFATANALSSVTLYYRVMFDAEVPVTMLDDGAHGDGAAGDGVYGATIPASASTIGQMVRYYIVAQDTSGYSSRLPVYSDPASTAQYLGTVVNPDYVTSAIPIVHLFAPTSILQPGPSTGQIGADSNDGGYVSVFHDGEFYDNVRMWLRGNTTAYYNKKSHRITFNKEHPFKHDGPGGRIRKTSFVADYPDPTYMRQGLSYWLCNEIGADGPFYKPVRLQLNGAFYQLANHNDVHGEELLERLGYDPNGALYNAAGTVVPGRSSTGGFDMKTRTWDKVDAYAGADYYALAAAISEANSTGQRMTNIFDRFDLPEIISYMVAARFVHENDDVWANMSIYHDNDGDDLWRIIPFDLNLSWGAAFMDSSDYSGIQVTNDYIKSFPMYGSSQAQPAYGGSWNRMYDVIFQVPQTREMFQRRMRTVLDEYVKPPGTLSSQVPIYEKVVEWRDKIAAEAALDRAWWGWPAKGGQCNFDPGIDLTNGVTILLNDFLENRRRHFYGKHCVTNTALTIGINKANNAGIPLSQPTNAVIAINGWDYNPVSGNQNEEYVRMTNANAFAVDISGWELDGGIHFKFRPGTVMPAGSVLYVSPNTRAFRARAVEPHGGHGLFVVGPCDGHLNAWGETLTLTDAAGRLVSSNSFAGNPSAAQRYLRVTEIMYNPSPFTSVTNDEQQFEYVELRNISTNVTLNLAGVRFTNGIQFNFTGSAVTSLAPGQTVLVARNTAAFTARYGSGFTIAGQFLGALDNGGETLRLEDAVGEKILEFAYNDTWYPITDGLGFSLVIVNENAHWSTWGQKAGWRASGTLNGSPGATDPAPPVISPILVNEALTHTDPPQLDSVELFNPGTNTVNIGGWFLTDDFYSPRKYRIPTGTTIGPGGYRVFTENQFNTGLNAFRFSEYGEKVCLFSGNATTNLTGYWHGYEFGEAPNGVSFGRYTNSQTNVVFTLQSALTLGARNAYPRVGPIVISEIMYRPPETNGLDNDQDEFIELQNITSTNVPLYYPGADTNTWRLRNAVDYDFPTNQVLGAGARLLVVGFNPTNTTQLAAFRSKYGISNSVPVFGPWSGKLDNSGETIELKQPDHPDLVEGVLIIPYIMIDKVSYQDQAPWPKGADGIGNSLQRFSNTGFGNDPTNWFAAGITAGRATVRNIAPLVSIVAPADGTTLISSNLTISVSASDADGSLALAQLFVDGAEILRWTTGPTNFVWTGASAGHHILRARAVDDLGAISESAEVGVTLIVPPPVLTILTPTNGAILVAGSTVTLGAQATSGGGDATSVSYYIDGTLLGTVAPPFNYSWTAGPSGYHSLSAIAMDEQGETSDTAEVSVFVQASSSNPVLVTDSSIWRYLDDGSNQGTNWIAPGFSDDGWASGASKLGYNNNRNVGLATVLGYGGNSNNKYVTYYFRHSFEVSSLTGMTNLYLEVQRDDGVAIYLNGTDLYREKLPTGTLSYTQLANDGLDNGNTWHAATLPLNSLKVGTNVLAAEIHQNQVGSSDIAFSLRLTLMGTALGPAITSQPQSQTVTNGRSASFAITATGYGPLAYQWRHAGTNLANCTSNRLTLPAVSDAHGGDFQVVVTNSIGSVTSLVATLTVVIADFDGDGLSDDWELANGTNPNVNDAGLDPDRDGFSNLQEYRAGTSPTNAASALRLESVAAAGDDAVFRFLAVSNRGYTIQMQPAVDDAWQKWLDIGAVPSNRTMVLTNLNTAGTNRFFRLVTPLQP